MNSIPIPWTRNVKYLGITLDEKLNFNKHVRNVENNARRIKGYMYPFLNRRSKLNNTDKMKIYSAIIRPTMTYAASSWKNSAENNIRRLQRVQNISIRQALNAPWYHTNEQLHRDIEYPTIQEHIQKTNENLQEKMRTHQNPLIRNITVR